MSDIVSGVAVIQHSHIAGLYRVHLLLTGIDLNSHCYLLFNDDRDKVSEDLEIAAAEPIWTFKRDHPQPGWLDCHPSIRQRMSDDPAAPDRFHNTFQWQVEYVEMRYGEPAHGQQHMQRNMDDAYMVWNDINYHSLSMSSDERAEYMAWLHQNHLK